MQAAIELGREPAGHLQEPPGASLRPVDAERDLHQRIAPDVGDNFAHHGESVFRRRRLHSKPTLAHRLRQPVLVDRNRVDVAQVLEHRRTTALMPMS